MNNIWLFLQYFLKIIMYGIIIHIAIAGFTGNINVEPNAKGNNQLVIKLLSFSAQLEEYKEAKDGREN